MERKKIDVPIGNIGATRQIPVYMSELQLSFVNDTKQMRSNSEPAMMTATKKAGNKPHT